MGARRPPVTISTQAMVELRTIVARGIYARLLYTTSSLGSALRAVAVEGFAMGLGRYEGVCVSTSSTSSYPAPTSTLSITSSIFDALQLGISRPRFSASVLM